MKNVKIHPCDNFTAPMVCFCPGRAGTTKKEEKRCAIFLMTIISAMAGMTMTSTRASATGCARWRRKPPGGRSWGFLKRRSPKNPPHGCKSPRKRANLFSDLVDQIAARGVILLTEDGEPFAYDEELGRYRPIPQLTAWLANFFPEITTRSLLANDLREIAQRLTWRQDLLCKRDEFNRSKELVNLENGVFNLETGELLEHDPRFRFLPTRSEPATWKTPEYINCPTFEAFCRSSLDGDPQKRQLLLEMIGYICSDLTVGKSAFS